MEVKEFSEFSNIELSLKALKIAITNQRNHSKMNSNFAWDIELSYIFVKSLDTVLDIMKELFGDRLDKDFTCVRLTF